MTANFIQDEERHFFRLCEDVGRDFTEGNEIRESDLDEAIEDMKDAFTAFTFADVDMENPASARAYFNRYGPRTAALVRKKFSQAIQNCGELEHILRETLGVFVMNIAAGPGTDMVGFFSAVYGVSNPKDILFFLVDPVRHFRDYASQIAWRLKEGDYGRASEFYKRSLFEEFMCLSLPCNDERYLRRMRNADIIIMCKLLSTLSYNDAIRIVQHVRECMKDSALLVFIDTPNTHQFLEGFQFLYKEASGEHSEPVFSIPVPEWYTNMHGPIPEYSKAVVAVLKK